MTTMMCNSKCSSRLRNTANTPSPPKDDSQYDLRNAQSVMHYARGLLPKDKVVEALMYSLLSLVVLQWLHIPTTPDDQVQDQLYAQLFASSQHLSASDSCSAVTRLGRHSRKRGRLLSWRALRLPFGRPHIVETGLDPVIFDNVAPKVIYENLNVLFLFLPSTIPQLHSLASLFIILLIV